MRMSEIVYSDVPPIDGYGPGFFRVGGKVFEGGLAVLPSGVRAWAGYEATDDLVAAAGDLDILLVGTGAEIGPVPNNFRTAIEASGVGIELMASPTACRTFNMLLAEGRRVGVALLPV